MTKVIIESRNSRTVVDAVFLNPGEVLKGVWWILLSGQVSYVVQDLGNGKAELRTYRTGIPWPVSSKHYALELGADDTVVLREE